MRCHSGGMTRTVARKMGLRPGWTAHFSGMPERVVDTLGLPELEVHDDPAAVPGGLDYIHLFVVTQDQMNARFPVLVPHLAPTGKLWLSWPKGGQLGSDLSLPKVIEIGYGYGLVESTCLALDGVWSGLRFTHPREGKVYRNRYGTLPSQR